ncbi:MAG: hypothetical protein IT381_21505 [Deltaproteobacteria bacterium]|nr:hypothetical protein [Deltaproteobacteria bacterium]
MSPRHAKKSNGKTFHALENKVAPMVVKLAESLERMGGQLGSDGGDGRGQAMMKIAKQIKRSREEAAREEAAPDKSRRS